MTGITAAKDTGRARNSAFIWRQPSKRQGKALEILGHAVEYLMDSHVLFECGGGDREDIEAIQLLMQLNLEIFEECPEIVPFKQRLRGTGSLLVSRIKSLFSF